MPFLMKAHTKTCPLLPTVDVTGPFTFFQSDPLSLVEQGALLRQRSMFHLNLL